MTRRFRWRGLTALALSVFTAGTLAACTAPSAAQATGATSDTLRVGVVGPTLVSIDPNTTLRTGSESIVWSVYSRLTSLDNNGQVKPDLATSWKQASTNSWTFTLRSGVTYSNGTPLTAEGNNDKVGLIAFTDRLELYLRPRKGTQHILRMARDLIYHQTRGRGTDISAATDFLMRVAKRPGVAFIISDFHAAGFESSIRLAAQKHDVIAVSITDPRELELPRVGLVGLHLFLVLEPGHVADTGDGEEEEHDQEERRGAEPAVEQPAEAGEDGRGGGELERAREGLTEPVVQLSTLAKIHRSTLRGVVRNPLVKLFAI